MTTHTRRRRYAAVLAAGLLAVAGCGGSGGDESGAAASSDSASPSGATDDALPGEPTLAAPYVEVPAGVTLTPPGTELAVGEPATAAWQPGRDLVGVVDVTVVGVQETTLEETFRRFRLSGAPEGAVPFLVTSEVTNVGATDLGGRRLPLYARDGEGRLVEATVVPNTFRACPRGALPQAFAPQATTRTCQVYLVPGDAGLAGVSFVPPAPQETVTWLSDQEAPSSGSPSPSGTATPSPAPSPGDGSPS